MNEWKKWITFAGRDDFYSAAITIGKIHSASFCINIITIISNNNITWHSNCFKRRSQSFDILTRVEEAKPTHIPRLPCFVQSMPSIQLGIGPSKQLVEVDKKRKVSKEKRKSFEGFNFCVEVLEVGLQRHVLLPIGFRQKNIL